jgi:uncharacterized surface protein with fasciclin (FAS1) repeats
MARPNHPHTRTVRILAPLAALSLLAASCGSDGAADLVDIDGAATTDMTESTDMTGSTDMTDGDETIVDVAMGNPDLSNLVAALESADLSEALSDEGPFTVFAPTNEAFETAVSDLGIGLDDFLTEIDLLESVLLTHTVSGEITSADIDDGATQMALSDTALEFAVAEDGTVTVNGITVVMAGIEASNGVVHLIDGVLFPAE